MISFIHLIQVKTLILFILLAIIQNNFIEDVHAFSMEHDSEALSDMCDTTMKDIE